MGETSVSVLRPPPSSPAILFSSVLHPQSSADKGKERTRLMIWRGGVVRVIQSGCRARGRGEKRQRPPVRWTPLQICPVQKPEHQTLVPSLHHQSRSAASVNLAAAAHWLSELCAAGGSFKFLILTTSNRH